MDQDWKSLRDALVQELANVRRQAPPSDRDEEGAHRMAGEEAALDRVLDIMDEIEANPAVEVDDA